MHEFALNRPDWLGLNVSAPQYDFESRSTWDSFHLSSFILSLLSNFHLFLALRFLLFTNAWQRRKEKNGKCNRTKEILSLLSSGKVKLANNDSYIAGLAVNWESYSMASLKRFQGLILGRNNNKTTVLVTFGCLEPKSSKPNLWSAVFVSQVQTCVKTFQCYPAVDLEDTPRLHLMRSCKLKS